MKLCGRWIRRHANQLEPESNQLRGRGQEAKAAAAAPAPAAAPAAAPARCTRRGQASCAGCGALPYGDVRRYDTAACGDTLRRRAAARCGGVRWHDAQVQRMWAGTTLEVHRQMSRGSEPLISRAKSTLLLARSVQFIWASPRAYSTLGRWSSLLAETSICSTSFKALWAGRSV